MFKEKNHNDAADGARPQMKEVHHHYHYGRGFNFGKLLFGVLIIIFGLFYLGRNTGWLPVTINFDWSIFWPILIVIAGLSLLSGRGFLSIVFGLLATLLVLAVIVAMLFDSRFNSERMGGWVWRNNNDISTTTGELKEKKLSIPRDPAAKSIEFVLKGGAGKVAVKGGSDELLTGKFSTIYGEVETSSRTEGTVQQATVETFGPGPMMMFGRQTNQLDLTLSTALPIGLKFETGASDMELDLTRLVAGNVNIETGASSLKVALGDKAKLNQVRIKAGASSVELEAPKTAGVRVVIDSALGSQDLGGLAKIDDRTYQSENYAAAEKKIDIKLDLGVTSLKLKLK